MPAVLGNHVGRLSRFRLRPRGALIERRQDIDRALAAAMSDLTVATEVDGTNRTDLLGNPHARLFRPHPLFADRHRFLTHTILTHAILAPVVLTNSLLANSISIVTNSIVTIPMLASLILAHPIFAESILLGPILTIRHPLLAGGRPIVAHPIIA